MKTKIFVLAFCLVSVLSMAQEEEKKFGINFSGFVKSDFFFDSRQNVAVREGHFLLFPMPKDLDNDNEDINAKSNFNFLSVQSRLSGKITGPDAFGAKTSGLIEGDFFAQANDNINLLRLRHAFVKLDWEKTQLLFGQYWNPMFVTSCYPGVISFNTGVPFQPFARNPQIRLTYNTGKVKFIAAALAQRDYASRGDNGASSEYLRNAAMPDMHAQLHFDIKNNGTQVVFGGGMAYKQIVPEIETGFGYKTDEAVAGLSALGFLKLKTDMVTAKFEFVHGENIPDLLAISGFAVKEITDITKGYQTYTPMVTNSFWTDIHTNGKKVQAGLFAGYTKNMGTKDDNADKYYGLGHNIGSQYRISPRIMVNSNKVRFAFETEYTVASYGTHDPDNKGEIINTEEVANIRLLMAVYYFF